MLMSCPSNQLMQKRIQKSHIKVSSAASLLYKGTLLQSQLNHIQTAFSDKVRPIQLKSMNNFDL